MTMLDPKGLEAATIAVEERGYVHFGGEIEAAIRAYLSTVTPAEVGGLVDTQAIEQAYETAVSQGEAGYPAAAFRAGYRTALEAQGAKLAEVHQRYVDANEARIDAETALAEARKALDAADYLAERLRAAWLGVKVRDMDEAEGAYRAARRAREQGGSNA